MTDSANHNANRQADAVVEELIQRPLIQSAFAVLSEKLPNKFVFHSLSHTKDVLREAVTFAVLDNLLPREVELIAIAAAYHDFGFIEGSDGHEQRGADKVREAMEAEGTFEEKEIVLVQRMILDTHLNETHQGIRQKSTTRLSGYLLDADLSNFGRDDFFQRLDAYVAELGSQRAVLAERTYGLMTMHEWKTDAARKLREAKKRENIAALEKELG